MTQNNLLFLDTESDIDTKQAISIQWRLNGRHGVLTDFNRADYTVMSALWRKADAIMFFNAPYDLGVLSSCFGTHNNWYWVKQDGGGYWDMELFGHRYKVRRIGGFRNLIKPFKAVKDITGRTYDKKHARPDSKPVIDLLKLWSILVDDGRKGSISLKNLIRRELHMTAIDYSKEAANTKEYQLQDVDRLEDLWNLFLAKTADIEDVQGYTYADWANIKTPATFVKLAYERAYPDLKTIQKGNFAQDEKHNLSYALEHSYHGGVTIALHRGTLDRTAWFDIHGAYAHAIEYLNTDRFLSYTWQELLPDSPSISDLWVPVLCQVETTALFTSINKSLKIFTLEHPKKCYMWNFDIQALKLIFPAESVRVLQAWEPIPQTKVTKSLPAHWSELKEIEQKAHGKTTLREYYKFMSNTSYGIKAQRNPFITKHTNMTIAGMITAKAHYVLFSMVAEAQRYGYRWVYSDTDSICISYSGKFDTQLEADINTRIAPFGAECEGYDMKTRILSLKRYISEGGKNIDGTKASDKIKLHGKGRYKIDKKTIYHGVMEGNTSNKPLILGQLSANTEISMKQLVNACPFCRRHVHPFAFHTNIPTDRTYKEWFASWMRHIDTKTTFIEGADMTDEFSRAFHHFETYYQAVKYWGAHLKEEGGEPEDLVADSGRYDEEVGFLFDSA